MLFRSGVRNNPILKHCWKCGKQFSDDKDIIKKFDDGPMGMQHPEIKYYIFCVIAALSVGLFYWIVFLLRKMR